ncbi:SigE family RNA polymerase sigma factor [Jatrophihabitans sp. YIM 134969]
MSGSADVEVGTSTFDAFVGSHSAVLLRAAWLLTGDRGGAEDLLQTTWSAVWPGWTTVAVMEFPLAYVRTAMVRSFVSSRRRRWWGETAVDTVPEAGKPDAADDLALRHVVAAALARLTARQRAVVVLRYFDDLDVAETAAALGCSVGTVKSQTAKALARLRSDATLTHVLEDL